MADARKRKEKRYPELLRGTRCRLVVTEMEVGGRWSKEVYEFLDTLALAKARDAMPILRGSACTSWKKRWCAMLSVAGMRAFADTLVYGSATRTPLNDEDQLALGEILGDNACEETLLVSRLPAHA